MWPGEVRIFSCVRQIKIVQNNKKWLHALIGKHFCTSRVNTELQNKLKGGLCKSLNKSRGKLSVISYHY